MVVIGIIEPEKRHAMRKYLTGEIIEKCNDLKSSVYRIIRQSVGEKPHAGGGLSKLGIQQQGVIILS